MHNFHLLKSEVHIILYAIMYVKENSLVNCPSTKQKKLNPENMNNWFLHLISKCPLAYIHFMLRSYINTERILGILNTSINHVSLFWPNRLSLSMYSVLKHIPCKRVGTTRKPGIPWRWENESILTWTFNKEEFAKTFFEKKRFLQQNIA